MKKISKQGLFLLIVVSYMILYIITIINHQFLVATLLKPGAAGLAYYALSRILKLDDCYKKAGFLLKSAYLLWTVVDLMFALALVLAYYGYGSMDKIYIIRGILYLIVRFLILGCLIQYYLAVTREYNPFQRFADMFTTICCMLLSFWLILIPNKNYLAWNYSSIFSLFFLLTAISMLGVIMISWFHYQNMKLTLGQRCVLCSVALMSFLDIAVVIHNPFKEYITISILYRFVAILIAVGCSVYSLYPTKAFFIQPKNLQERIETSWKNVAYFFAYPIFVILIVGFQTSIVFFLFLYAFYITACRYVRQFNITEQLLLREKEKEAQLQKALIRANAATEAKSLFLANMSHEIRTPMNAVIGMSYLALKTELNEKQTDYILKINNAANDLLGLINDILDFSKIESGKVTMEKVNFNLDEVVSKSIELLVQKARNKNIDFVYRLSCDVPILLRGDPFRLGQIITNLVSNAIKFTKEGMIRIDITEERRNGKQVCLNFSITDTGIGIAKENQCELFDAFTQSDNSITRQYGGTGLGLAICQKLVELMDGNIWAESELDKGSKFSFAVWFDIQEFSNENKRCMLKDINSIKALIVDNNHVSRKIVKEYLEYIGVVADEVELGSKAIELIQQSGSSGSYQLVLIDCEMSSLDGVETVRQLSLLDFDKRPTAVLISAYDIEEMKKQTNGFEVAAYLSKPVTQSSLYDAIVKIQEDSLQTVKCSLQERNYHIDGVRILLAEDNEINQQIVCELLASQGCVIDVANNGREAVERLEGNYYKYDLVLMDIQMPEMDGLEATIKIREHSKDIPIIAMTARIMRDEKERCQKVGMNDHVAKPIVPVMFLATVKKWTR